jgi:general secretion pathway protein F
MPIFRYKGYKPDGAHAAGTVEADGLQNALRIVRTLGIYPKEVTEHVHKSRTFFPQSYDVTLLPHITRQLSTLLSAGVTLVEALKSMSEESSGFWRGLLVSVRERVTGGASLSRALEAYPEVFPEFYRNMVAAGEQSGSLDRVLVRVADFLEKQATIRSRIRLAMIYPLFMISVGFIILSFLFIFVVPKIVRIFESTKSALPFITVVLITVSNFFVHYWWLVVIAACALMVGTRHLREKHRMFIDSLKLRLPGGVLQSLYFGRFARTLGFLLDGGLPVLRALELSAQSVGNVVLGSKIMASAKNIAEGAKISASLEGFPPVLLRLISTGEKSGTLAEVLKKAADSYEEEFERRVQKGLSLLEPSMILIMGLLVGFIVFAVLLPLFQLNQLVK